MSVGSVFTGIVFAALLAAACGGGMAGPPSEAIVTFAVGDETFRVWLTTAEQVAAARAAQQGDPARIPNGRIAPGTQVNAGWSWHLEDVEFAEMTMEICDGRPSDVERQGAAFGAGRFCPWTARIVRIDEK